MLGYANLARGFVLLDGPKEILEAAGRALILQLNDAVMHAGPGDAFHRSRQ